MNVTQRHNATTASVASCIARIADAEWLKACEDVRLLAPNVGTLTQWRMLCEGGWTEAMPQGLPDGQETLSSVTDTRSSSPDIPDSMGPVPQDSDVPATQDQQLQQPFASISTRASPAQQRQPLPSPRVSPNVSAQNLTQPDHPTQREPPPSPHLPNRTSTQNIAQQSTPPIVERPPPPSAFDTLKPPFFDPTTGSVRTLSAFPTPPSHFPIPPVRQQTQLSLQSISSNTGTSAHPFSESPISASQELAPQNERQNDRASSDNNSYKKVSPSSSPEQQYRDYRIKEERKPSLELSRPQPVRATTSYQPTRIVETEESRDDRRQEPRVEDYQRQREPSEFGEQRAVGPKAHTYDVLRRGVERTDSIVSNGSLVAAMRDRYSSNVSRAYRLCSEHASDPRSSPILLRHLNREICPAYLRR